MDVGGWLRNLGLEQYELAFREHKIDDRVLPSLTAEDLKDLGVGFVGDRRKLLDAIAALRVEAVPVPLSNAPLAAHEAAKDTAERRQVTVMFSDLVASTALSTRMDPEDLREVISAYQTCVAETIDRFGGFIAKYMGDGVLIYFGYPQANEDDVERAVRAGLELTAAVRSLKTHEALQTRVGIATGLVVIGDLIGSGASREQAIVGETPNLAARLQGIAEPNAVVIAESTRRLLGNLFELQDLGTQDLKGIDRPVPVWAALRPSSTESRFDALHVSRLTALVGREEELELLAHHWEKAKTSEGQVVLLSGEAGIGKSRLTVALLERLATEPHARLRFFCQPHQQGSPLQPIIAQLQHAAGFARNDAAAEKRAKLETLLAPSDEGDLAPIAELLGLASGCVERVSDPRRVRQLLLNALIKRLETLARTSTVLMLFEDVHWADPSSLELLTLTIDHLQTLPVLLVVTFRSEYQPPWAGHAHVTMLTLNRLSQCERATLVDQITGGKSLPVGLLDHIVDHSDGVPLFVEELTKAVIESDHLQEAGGQYVLDQSARPVVVPTTLQASLMARLDRLGAAREVLQICAAIGREFSYELLAAVADRPDVILRATLERLARAELVFQRGTPPSANYVFKHALVQESAYSAMLRARRQNLHASIGLVLEARFPDVVETRPEMIAQQFELAAQSKKAITYFRRAGERDLRRFAMKESIGHYSNALRLVSAMPKTADRDALELDVRLGLALVLQITHGASQNDAAAHYQQALKLSQTLPDRGRECFLASWGLWFNAAMSGAFRDAAERSDQLVTIARELDDTSLLMEAYHARVPVLLMKPDFAQLIAAAQEVLRLYDRQAHRDHAYYFGGHDARMCARSFYAMGLWGRGLVDQAQAMSWLAVDDARQLGHPFSLAHALQRAGMTMMLLNDEAGCRAVADELYPLSEHNKFPWQLADAKFCRGWLAARQGHYTDGRGPMVHSAELLFFAPFQAFYLIQIAEAELRAKQFDRAMTVLDRAVRAVEGDAANHFCEPEIYRLRGEVLFGQSRANAGTAEWAFRNAKALAAQQSCPVLELRAATSLARLLADTQHRREARDLLALVYAGFIEGFDKPDLQASKVLLSELN